MERHAPYALIGLIVLAAIGAIFGFVYWLNNAGGLGKQEVYQIQFENSVSGLLKGASVLFNGIKVGEVTKLQLSAEAPRSVMATIAVAAGTPVRADTHVGLDFQGLTGVPVIALEGRSKLPPSIAPAEVPTLKADPNAGVSMTQAARDSLLQLQTLLTQNAEPLHSTIENLSTFASALARNSAKLDGIVTGLERLTGGGSAATPINVYDLTAPKEFPEIKKAATGQLSIPEPTGVLIYDTQKFLFWPINSEEPTFLNARWSDNIPKLLQARIIQSFENAGLLSSVARPMEGLTASRQLLIDIRSFQFLLAPAPRAEVEISVKIVGDDGKIIDARIFHTSVSAAATDAPAAATALDKAFGKTAVELVAWAADLI